LCFYFIVLSISIMETRARVRRAAELAATEQNIDNSADDDFVEDECLDKEGNIEEKSDSILRTVSKANV